MADDKKAGYQVVPGGEDAVLAFGLDVPRLWVTGCRVAQLPHETVIIFREDVNVFDGEAPDHPEAKHQKFSRNVASFVMPNDVARQLGEILLSQLGNKDSSES